ncbi:neprilysin-21-like [Haematobia irritans]|uniref:neprilysin-21-like n=1 Tax=Haematobia irritans TaxID=7368 RepID=UPI003F502FD7
MKSSNWLSIIAVAVLLIGPNRCSICEAVNSNSSHFFNQKLRKQMQNYLDVEVNPCENFYQYACGKWSKNQHQQDAQNISLTSTVEIMNYEINQEYVQYLDTMILRNKPKFVQKTHTFYSSCLRLIGEKIELKNFIKWMQENTNMKWTLMAQYSYDWIETLGRLRRYGLNGIFLEEDVYDNYDGKLESVIVLDKPTVNGGFLSLNQQDWKWLIENLIITRNELKPAMDLMDKILDFERNLMELEEVPDDVGLAEIMFKNLPLPWLPKYLQMVLNLLSVDPNMKIQILNIPYMKALDELLQQYENDFLCRYLELRFLWQLSQTPRNFSSTNCVAVTRGFLSLPMNWIYEQLYPELEQEIPKIQEIFTNIVEYIKKKMKEDKSGIVTPKVLEKLQKVQLKVGNLPRINTLEVLNSFYENLHFNPQDFYGNVLQVSHFFFNVSHSGYGNSLTHNINELFNADSYYEGSSFLPYYLNTPNVMIAPLTLMRQPFYHWGYDDVFKYSTLGNRFAILLIKDLMETCAVETEDLQKLVEISGFHSAYGAFLSTLPDDLRNETFIRESQLIFFLNSAQIKCDVLVDHDLNAYMTHFPEFSDLFHCKLRHFLQAFENLRGVGN